MKQLVNLLLLSVLLLFFLSCTTAKISVPTQFSSQATRMPVKGLNGWMVNQKLSFGNYTTSSIKRGWDFTATVRYTHLGFTPKDMVLSVFNIDQLNGANTQKGKFQYMLENGSQAAEIFATERFTEKELVYKSNNPFLGDINATQRYEYAFSAAIVPLTTPKTDAWSLVMINKYDAKNDTARKLLDRPYVSEEGYATNGKETIAIRSLRLEKMTTKNGKQTKVFGGALLSGYEFRIDNGVVAIVDILDNAIWIYNELDEPTKLICSSMASAILLKRVQNPEQKDFDQP